MEFDIQNGKTLLSWLKTLQQKCDEPLFIINLKKFCNQCRKIVQIIVFSFRVLKVLFLLTLAIINVYELVFPPVGKTPHLWMLLTFLSFTLCM